MQDREPIPRSMTAIGVFIAVLVTLSFTGTGRVARDVLWGVVIVLLIGLITRTIHRRTRR